ncbi:MAG: hypothetical protein LC104_19170 [Bacteroidales bacterium]|nr:hypothetical protein [Bacteroidales bacterium]
MATLADRQRLWVIPVASVPSTWVLPLVGSSVPLWLGRDFASWKCVRLATGHRTDIERTESGGGELPRRRMTPGDSHRRRRQSRPFVGLRLRCPRYVRDVRDMSAMRFSSRT